MHAAPNPKRAPRRRAVLERASERAEARTLSGQKDDVSFPSLNTHSDLAAYVQSVPDLGLPGRPPRVRSHKGPSH
jgi:hypothetical protein